MKTMRALLTVLLLCLLVAPISCAGHASRNGDDSLTARLMGHVDHLAGEIGQRNVYTPGSLDRARDYIVRELVVMGYSPRFQEFRSRGMSVFNIEAEAPGGLRRGESVLVAAHYDSVRGAPGADDNATGVAAALELARMARTRSTARTLMFAFLVNEEFSALKLREKGNWRRAHKAKKERENIRAVVAVDCLGWYSDAAGSQQSKPPTGTFPTDRGDFLAFAGLDGSEQLVRRCHETFAQNSSLPAEAIVLGFGGWPYFSDIGPFTDMGYPAVLATDTGPFRNPHYHEPDDTPGSIDTVRFTQAVQGVAAVVFELANER